jgi:hypothetical protein
MQVCRANDDSFNHFKMVEVHTFEVDALLAPPLSLAEQWVKFGNHC